MTSYRSSVIGVLVVIAIIVILAAMLLPALSQARAKAHQASCMSNLKQIALGFYSYTDNYDEWIAPRTMGNGWGFPTCSQAHKWTVQLRRELPGGDELWQCPSSVENGTCSGAGSPVIAFSYGINERHVMRDCN